MNSSKVSKAEVKNVSNISTKTLSTGDVVKGRVVDYLGNKNYIISLAGRMLGVRSEVPLKKGISFTALLKSENGKFILKLLNEENNSGSGVLKFNSSSLKQPSKENLAPQIMRFLQSLNLSPDISSLRLVQFAKEMGIKFEPEKFRRAADAGSDSDESETDEKKQMSLLLQEKGLGGTKISVDSLYGYVKKITERKNNSPSAENLPSAGFPDAKFSEADVSDFVEEMKDSCSSENAGPLTSFNMILSQNKDFPHWVLIPFEWDFENFTGLFRICFDAEKKIPQKIIIDCKNDEKKYIFVLYFNNGKIQKVKWCADFDIDESQFSVLQDKFPFTVERCEFSALSGFCPDDSEISVFEVNV